MTSLLHRCRVWLRAFLLAALLPVFTVGCLTADASGNSSSAATQHNPLVPEITIVGVALHSSSLTGTITLMESGKGLTIVSLTSSTQYRSVEGGVVSLGDIKRGMMIQVTGETISGALVARQVRMLEAARP